ncbi:protein Shroom isoform X2 [Aphidius gifuensis]|uniref:protein Shroom isoform X2 n=1 Tax=Aphidius gifuensis TaxID=684658 RepID=UPI001CDCE247|nr:protein Shroom isoform X2 [Aphidius gifuensis]
MADAMRKGPRNEQWFSSKMTTEKEDKKSGAFNFIRSRGSMRRQLSRESTNRSKSSEDHHGIMPGENSGSGGFGKWLRDHLKGSKNTNETDTILSSKNHDNKKVLSKITYTPQNVYCSLPREQRRHNVKNENNQRRPRSESCNLRERSFSNEINRVYSFYENDNKCNKKKNKEKRRHSMNETREHRNLRKSCISNGGSTCNEMTELQPSPTAYRGQDDTLGTPSCTQNNNGIKYSGQTHQCGTKNYKNINIYPQDNYHKQQSSCNTTLNKNNHQYHRNNNNCHDNINIQNDHNNIDHNDGYKKNTPGYKNDSGYSESIGFDSFSLTLNERDSSSPPPTPPVRDASSLKGVCYGPGHEKYPSWPSASECNYDDEQHNNKNGSHRSKSWTDHTNYPKEKPQQYTRPSIIKRPNPTFTQQLKTVMERCEKIPSETFESRGLEDNQQQQKQPRLWPRVDREGKSIGDAEYVVPSPPEHEQEQPGQTLSHADLEAYVRSYQDPSQAGLEEYTRVQHSQQASYAQSEGYHSYVSSVDSTTTTPFLDRLRRDSEAAAQRPSTWIDTSREGRDSVVTTSSNGSASSSETLKWHGSMSDVSLSSGLRQVTSDNNWQHKSLSDVTINSNINNSNKKINYSDKWPGSMCDVSKNIIKNNDKWQININDRNFKQNTNRINSQGVINHCSSVNDVCNLSDSNNLKWQESNIDINNDDDVDDDNSNSNNNNSNNTGQINSPIIKLQQKQQQQPQQEQQQDDWNNINDSMSDVSQTNISINNNNNNNNSKQLIAHSARVQTPQRHHSESVLYLDRERNKRKLYPISTTQIQDNNNTIKQSSPPQINLSVADRINELEKQQQMKYTYLDPDKRHRVSDPTLKAIQKKALLSFYERHHHHNQSSSSWRSEPYLLQSSNNNNNQNYQLSLTQQSTSSLSSSSSSTSSSPPPPQPPPRPRALSSRRASSASDYANGTWRDNKINHNSNNNILMSNSSNNNNNINNDLKLPKHQHSNSCGSLSMDLHGSVVMGPTIKIDNWVPERPPKKPHLRNVFNTNINNERLPSPDLPPPSPPTVTVNEVLNCDEPLPPPPPPEINHYNEMDNNHNTNENTIIRKSKKNIYDNNYCKTTFNDDNNDYLKNNNVSRIGRSSLRYPSGQKLTINNGYLRRSVDDKNSTRPPAILPDLLTSKKYDDCGHQKASPQVPVEIKLTRHESMRNNIKNNDNYLFKNYNKPQPQVPIINKTNYMSSLTSETMKSQKYHDSIGGNGGFNVGNKVRTSYEANSKLIHEGSPQKYHEPPKYIQPRNYFALPPKYIDAPVSRTDNKNNDNYLSGLSTSSTSPPPPPPPLPPPLAPRQNTPGRKSLPPPPPRPAPPPQNIQSLQGSTSKASYLAYRRERGAPDSEGSYKRTMSPTARLDEWQSQRDDPVLLRVTPYNNHQHERPKSHSIDTSNNRIDEHSNAHTVEVIGKLSNELTKKLQSTEQRTRFENNNSNNNFTNINNSNSNNNNDINDDDDDKLTPNSIHGLNDINHKYDIERRKNTVSCETINNTKLYNDYSVDDYYRDRNSSTIEMTSKNVELLNRKNQGIEKNNCHLYNCDKSIPPLPSTSPPRSPILNKSHGAISRVTDSTSSLSSSSSSLLSSSSSSSTTATATRNTIEQSKIKTSKLNINDISVRKNEQIINNNNDDTINSRIKISSPSQTDNTWTQNDIIFRNKLRRTSSLGSRSSTLSSNSKTSSSTSISPSYSPIDRKQSPCLSSSSSQFGYDGLQIVQRSEIIVKINSTTDASSQTDLIDDDKTFINHDYVNLIHECRKKLPEEIECEELSRDLVNQLGPNDKLSPILVPAPEHKKPRDYVTGLFRVESTLQSRLQRPASTSSSLDNDTEDDRKNDTMPTSPINEKATSGPLSPTSAYFTISESKAKFLTRYSRDVTDVDIKNASDEISIQSNIDNLDLRQKKEELVLRLDRKVIVLRAEQEAVKEEVEMNDALGAKVTTKISAVARPVESSKFRLHIEEIGKITSLLLGLSGRLARAENALYGMSDDHPEKKILESKRDKLLEQLEEAKILKINIDKRSVNVSSILLKYLNDDEFADYQHFINMKTKLIMDGREIQDKVKLGEEQLAALKEAIS